jgi:7-cyano-7-deazaguanine synthase
MKGITVKKVVVGAGGMDSITNLYLATKEEDVEVFMLSFDYGARNNAKEIPFAIEHCALLGVRHEIVKLDFIGQLFRSDFLNREIKSEAGHYGSEEQKKNIVPFRNGIFHSIAAGFANSIDATEILIGSHAHVLGESPMKDGSAEYRDKMNAVIAEGIYGECKITTPLINMTKADIALLGVSMGIDYSRTWSCYNAGELQCGFCPTCTERRESFLVAGIPDPTEYEDTTGSFRTILGDFKLSQKM